MLRFSYLACHEYPLFSDVESLSDAWTQDLHETQDDRIICRIETEPLEHDIAGLVAPLSLWMRFRNPERRVRSRQPSREGITNTKCSIN